MIMPFIRLLTIYALVIIAVVAFFQRDALTQLSNATFGWPASETAPEVHVETTEPEPQQQPGQTAQTLPVADPAPQTVAASLPVIQMPVAVSEAEASIPKASIPKASTPEAAPAPVAPARSTAEETAESPASDDIKTRLNAARQAYWQGDLDGARALYGALAKAAPNDPDVNGEFGNILFAQRQFDAAADAYLTTGRLLVQQGQRQQVQAIIAVLQNIAPQKAATLRALANN
ncbi:MAG: hypothetical protein L3J36_05425 [Rhodobacteraceae bacterium]|nr:hypothetical protein [Paracoccaceae bacterium]